MIRNIALFLIMVIAFFASAAGADETGNTAPARRITLHEALLLALKHNHDIRLAGYTVEENQHAKEVARSAYLPTLRNDSSFFHMTDTQFIEIPAGSLGVVGSNALPPRPLILNQGGKDFFTSGTGLTQPLTELIKIRAKNDVARAEVEASRGKASEVENDVELKVRQLYYRILVTESQNRAIAAKIRAVEELQGERVQQVKYGSTLEVDLIEARAQSLQAKQELLTTELQLSDLHMQFNDVVGLPINTDLALDPNIPSPPTSCDRKECIKVALDSHPEIAQARAMVGKAEAGVRAAKREYIPDVEAFARYSHQNNSVPFLAPNFGTFGVHLGYDLFDGGKKRATLRERDAELAQAKENLARISDEVELRVQSAYNRLEKTQQMLKVSEEVLALRTESNRVLQQELLRGTALNSQADLATAQKYDAETLLLQSQLDYVQSHDEVMHAMGRTPE